MFLLIYKNWMQVYPKFSELKKSIIVFLFKIKSEKLMNY